MNSILDVLKFFVTVDNDNISWVHILLATFITAVVYLFVFLIQKYGQKQEICFSFIDFAIKVGVAFIIDFVIIWLYGPKLFILTLILGPVVAIYVRNKVFSFIDSNTVATKDLKMRSELADLKNKFKSKPYFDILDVLLYYGYISTMQKDLVEAENMFKSQQDMARELLTRPTLTEAQLNEAIGIMNVIMREGKIITREEALLTIMNIENSLHSSDDLFKPLDEMLSHTDPSMQMMDPIDKEKQNSDVGK